MTCTLVHLENIGAYPLELRYNETSDITRTFLTSVFSSTWVF